MSHSICDVITLRSTLRIPMDQFRRYEKYLDRYGGLEPLWEITEYIDDWCEEHAGKGPVPFKEFPVHLGEASYPSHVDDVVGFLEGEFEGVVVWDSGTLQSIEVLNQKVYWGRKEVVLTLKERDV